VPQASNVPKAILRAVHKARKVRAARSRDSRVVRKAMAQTRTTTAHRIAIHAALIVRVVPFCTICPPPRWMHVVAL
jgi:hypothetical protein